MKPNTPTSRNGSYRLVRQFHLWIGAWGALAAIVYGFSGLVMNHRFGDGAWPQGENEELGRESLSVAAEARATPEQLSCGSTPPTGSMRRSSARDRLAVSGGNRPGGGERGGSSPVRRDRRQPAAPKWTLSGGTAREAWSLEYTPGAESAELKRSAHSPLSAINRLHKGVGGGWAWILLADSFAIGMLLLGISGIWMWLRGRSPRDMVLSVFAVSLADPGDRAGPCAGLTDARSGSKAAAPDPASSNSPPPSMITRRADPGCGCDQRGVALLEHHRRGWSLNTARPADHVRRPVTPGSGKKSIGPTSGRCSKLASTRSRRHIRLKSCVGPEISSASQPRSPANRSGREAATVRRDSPSSKSGACPRPRAGRVPDPRRGSWRTARPCPLRRWTGANPSRRARRPAHISRVQPSPFFQRSRRYSLAGMRVMSTPALCWAAQSPASLASQPVIPALAVQPHRIPVRIGADRFGQTGAHRICDQMAGHGQQVLLAIQRPLVVTLGP